MIIRKVRYIVYHMGNKWEIDEFLGENEGLVIAECELSQATLNPPLPDFVGEDTCQEEIVNDNDFVSEQDEYSSKEVKFY